MSIDARRKVSVADTRSSFLSTFPLADHRFEEAITHFCVACEYNLRLSKQGTLPMKGMDNSLLIRTRRLCFDVRIKLDR